jgi:hypothetical protein
MIRIQLRPSLRTLATCLFLLALSRLPAFADHIHHLWYNNSAWQDKDLTALTHGGTATSYGGIAAFYTTPNHQPHVYYVDSNAQHVHQLYNDGKSWTDEDLTAYTGGPAAYAFGITGFAIGNLQYVFYVDTSSHVHELNYDNLDWTDQDLTATVGGNLASPAPLVAFATKPNNQFHVYYQDSSSLHEYQLYFDGTSWTYQDLTAMIGGPYCYTTWIAGFAQGNEQHLFCPGYGAYSANLDMLHIFYGKFGWAYEDVTYETIESGGSQTPMHLGSGVAAFKLFDEAGWIVLGVTDDTHVNLYSAGTEYDWADLDLTSTEGAPTDGQYGGIVAFPTTPNGQYHIYYAPSGEVYQLYYNGTWAVEDLTNGKGKADPNSGMAGFAIGNLQHVFYMSVD